MIHENIEQLVSKLPTHVRLVAVSKFHSEEEIMEAYNAGQRDFGENRPQEMAAKQQNLPKDIRWHFIGNLQKNKVKLVVQNVFLIHSVSSVELLQAIDEAAKKTDKMVDCLLEFHIAGETTKQGFDAGEINDFLASDQYKVMKNIRIRGVMGMASFVDDMQQVRKEFKTLKSHFDNLKQQYFIDNEYFTEISMGMSGDYEIAIEEGSTMVRIGTSIFGPRNY